MRTPKSPTPKLLYKTIPGVSALSIGFLSAVWMLDAQPALPTAGKALRAPQPTSKLVAALPQPAVANPFGPIVNDLRGAARSKIASLTQDPLVREPKPAPIPEPVVAAQKTQEAAPQSIDQAFQYEAELPQPPRRPSELGPSRISTALTDADDRDEKTLTGAFQYEEDLPTPPRRPSDLTPPPTRVALPAPLPIPTRRSRQAMATPAQPQEDNRSFVEKIFGGMQSQPPRQPSGQTLAYAAPQSTSLDTGRSIFSNSPTSRFDRYTAVYDISAHTVYLPSGARLEAHSGLGSRLDDPRFVHERMRGATPPSVYELSPREQLFHGVAALRLKPLSGNVYGRAGLLAHTYMLGPNGDSNGCVSFRNYDAFLQAYRNGEIKRLAVVASL